MDNIALNLDIEEDKYTSFAVVYLLKKSDLANSETIYSLPQEQILNELKSLNKQIQIDVFDKLYGLTISICTSKDLVKYLDPAKRMHRIHEIDELIGIKFSLLVDDIVISSYGNVLYMEDEKNNEVFEEFDYDNYARICIFIDILSEIELLDVSCQIAFPFILRIVDRLYFINDSKEWFDIQQDINSVHLSTTAIKANKRFIENIEILSLSNTYKWVQKNVDILNGASDTNLCVAMCSYMKLLQKNNEVYIDLLWSMVGIESIYNNKERSSETSITNQIVVKSQSLFGEIPGLKKSLKNMYNTRSQFIHGGLRISGLIPFEKEELIKVNNSRDLCILVLVATIQHAVKNDWQDIKFKQEVSVEGIKR